MCIRRIQRTTRPSRSLPLPTTHPLLYAPEADGGCEWPSAACSPRTGYVYFGTSYFPEEITANKSNTMAFGSALVSPVPGIPARVDYGIFGAIDTNIGTVAWTIHVPQPAVSGVAVGGDLVFFGEGNGLFVAANVATGQILWTFDGTSIHHGGGANAQPSIYVSNGREFIVNAFGGNNGDRSANINSPLGDAIVAFSLEP